MKMRVGFLSFLTLFAFAEMAQEQPAWRLSTTERIARRLDPQRVAQQSRDASNRRDGAKRLPRFIINGGENPELFLPTELMAFLLSDFGESQYRDATRA
jgi:hypothetical protein